MTGALCRLQVWIQDSCSHRLHCWPSRAKYIHANAHISLLMHMLLYCTCFETSHVAGQRETLCVTIQAYGQCSCGLSPRIEVDRRGHDHPGGLPWGSAQSACGVLRAGAGGSLIQKPHHGRNCTPLCSCAASTLDKLVVSCFTTYSTCFRSTLCSTTDLLQRCTMRGCQREASLRQPHRRLSREKSCWAAS